MRATHLDKIKSTILELVKAGAIHPDSRDAEVRRRIEMHLLRQGREGYEMPSGRTFKRYLPRCRPLWRGTLPPQTEEAAAPPCNNAASGHETP
jgi:hypothetical protein